jgi:mRNA interferase RelE/StbE
LKVEYRQLFLKDLKKLKKQSVYQRILNLAFEILPTRFHPRICSGDRSTKIQIALKAVGDRITEGDEVEY